MTATHRRCFLALLAGLVLTTPSFAEDAGARPHLEPPAADGGAATSPPPAATPPTTPRPTTPPTTSPTAPPATPAATTPPARTPPPPEAPALPRATPPTARPPAPARPPTPPPEAPPPRDSEEEAELEGEANEETDAPEPAEAAPPGHAVSYREHPSPLVFRVPARGRSPEARARAATAALTEALDEKRQREEDGVVSELEVELEDDRAVVRVGRHVIATLYPEDARAEGMTLARYAPHMESRLDAFIDAQLQRQAFQLFFLHLFLSVLFGVIGFLTLRGLRSTFDRWDAELDERRGSFKPISVLRIPVFSGEALASALAIGLAVGRVFAYVATVIATVVAVLSQFELTRPLLRRIVSWSAGPVLNAVEAVVTAVPGVILAALLVFALRAGLRVLNILLDGVASKRLQWRRLPPERVPVFRFSATAVAVLVAAPLLVAAAFGRWGTPLETLALSAGVAVVVAAIPLIASSVVGVFMLWRGPLKPGDWVQVGKVSGEVTRVGFSELNLVPESGGTIAVPMLYLLLHPLQRLRQSPAVSFEITIARDRPAKALVAALQQAVIVAESDAEVELVDLGATWLRARVSAPAVRGGVRQQIMIAISDAVDRGELELPTSGGGS